MADQRPFEEIVAEHGAVVMRVCRALLGPSEAEDAWAETFLAALRAYPTLRADSNVRGWLVTIAHRKAIDHIRSSARAPLSDGRVARAASRTGRTPPRPCPTAELWSAVAALPAGQRTAVVYHYVAGLPYAEIAALTDTAVHGHEAPRRRRHRQPAQALSRRNHTMTATDLLAAIPAPDPDAAARLHDRLVEEADGEGLLDVSYRTLDSPVGPLLLAATSDGLVRVAFDREDHDAVLATLAAEISPRILRAPRRLDDVARQLDEYFARRRRRFDLPVDLQLAHGYRRTVLTHLRAIPYGSTETYATVAASTGRPAAVRAVGTACARNPLPLVVPCHRVVRSDGTIGQYGGGPEVKERLLQMEGAA